jgi:hypothetical protein
MAKRTLEVKVTYIYTLEVDDENHIVQEYVSDEELVQHLIDYRFKSLPVLEGEDRGVVILDVEEVEHERN